MTLTRSAWFEASTEGLLGGWGRPIGVTVPLAGVHGPTDVAPTAATSHWYVFPLVSPSTTAVRASETPSFDSIQSPSPVRQRTL